MKFMKLGSRPDTFYTTETIRSVSSEVSSDLIVQVKGTRFLLHKFPLLSKCLRLQKLCAENLESLQHQIIQLPDFPGGIEAFETCAKFCYGITITLSSYNIVATRCAAEYLQMTEDAEKGNLMYKIEVFFNSCILQGWKDSILTLQNTKPFASWSEELGITSKCIEAIASKVHANPSKVCLSHSYSRKGRDDLSCNGSESQRHKPKGWWGEDIAELSIDLYWRTMIAIKSGGKVPVSLIGDALRVYAARWLLNISRSMIVDGQIVLESDTESVKGITSKHRLLLESIVSLLPAEKGAVSCGFLSKLLKAANIVKASSSSKVELARKMGIQLDDATVNDLLIPSSSSSNNNTTYDVDVVITILEQFMLQGQSPPTSPPKSKTGLQRRRSRSVENIDFEFQESRRSSSASHGSKLKVAKIIDGYLQEIAKDVNLPLSKFLSLAESIPEFARVDHDDLYKAIDIYLKVHQELNKSERKRLCRILDCRKLSMQACIHAAQNELLPLRVLVQVLFFEQSRSAMAGGSQVSELPSNIKAMLETHDDHHSSSSHAATSFSNRRTADDQWSVSGLKSTKSKIKTLKMKLAEDDDDDDDDVHEKYLDQIEKSSRSKSFCMIPHRPKRMFSKLWPINKSTSLERNG